MFLGDRFKQVRDRLAGGFARIVRHVLACGVVALDQSLHRIVGGEVGHRWFSPGFLRPELDDGFAHGHAAPVGSVPIDLLITPLCFRCSVDVFGRLLNEVLGQVHDLAKIRICLIELKHGELGVPAPAQPLVAEVAVDLVDAIEPTHRKPLEIKLGRDAKIQVDVERVVMCDEWLRHGAARDGLHHGSLDLDETLRVHVAAEGLHELAALQENFADLRIHDQVDISLAIA